MIAGVKEFLRNAAACLKSGMIDTLPTQDRLALLDSALMWTDAAVIADGETKPDRKQ